MAKGKKTVYFCQNCGHEEAKWLGQCPMCKEWNTFVEERIDSGITKGTTVAARAVNEAKVVPITEVSADDDTRNKTGIKELDRVLGGGIVPGSLVLVGGDPGIGKSTLLLQVCQRMAKQQKILYISGEESQTQIKLRANRMGEFSQNLLLLCETNLGIIRSVIEKEKPELVIIDSIQTMYSEDVNSAPGSVSQVRESTNVFMQLAKGLCIPIFIVGHVTKEGTVAGPRVLEHMVDTVLYFEGDRHASYRILRGVKNRFGSTSETGIFAMVEEGLQELSNPSASLLAERSDEESGSAVMIYLEGVRPILVEVQSLVVTTAFGMPRRTAIGYDLNRLIVLLAVLEKRCGFTLGNKDVYVNVIGGLKVNEPACDLSMAVAIVSNLKNRIVPTDMVILGEVGLTGNVRSIPRIEQRINEAKKLGFKKFIIPEGNYKQIKDNDSSIKIKGVKSIQEAMQLVFS